MADDDEHGPPSHGGGGGLNRKIGPLPMWGWAVGVGALVGLVFFLRKGKSVDTSAADSAAGGSGDTTPTSLIPISEGLAETQTQAILDALKKLQGPPSEDDDDDDDDDDKPTHGTLPGKIPPGTRIPKPVPVKRPTPRSSPKTVTVVKWTRDHTPWNSTLWGIAQHEHVKGGWQYLQKINHMHGDPKKHLQPGMKIKLG
jgi:hypothetical protein